MLLGALLLNILSIQHLHAFLIRSFVAYGTHCNRTAGTACFAELYGMIEDVCLDKDLSFRCVHYTFLDECFEARVGKCSANAVSHCAQAGYRAVINNCESTGKWRNQKQNDGATQLLGRVTKSQPSSDQLVSTLGYLQVQCSLSRHKNCSSNHVNNIITQCEEHMKPKSGFSQFDRHRLLRIKLDTSKKLMMYEETDRDRECLVVRSIFSELYGLHKQYCNHSIVTRCLCERLKFDVLCSIDCEKLEAKAPNQNQLTWDEWKRARLIRSSTPLHLYIYVCVSVFALVTL